MCGIVGFVSKERMDSTVEKMLKVQTHRGPDDNGTYVESVGHQHVHFGHNRLSVQDVSSNGHQPFISDCGNYVLVFNGEVYNFKSIRNELDDLGCHFVSDTDTEVVLYAYKRWGISCLQKFIGMFAFSIFDKIQNKIILVRDRAGVKPLYYYEQADDFLFSSELKAFHEHPLFKKESNSEVLPYYFQFGYIPAPHTIFKNTYKLSPGQYLEYDLQNSSSKIVKYWDVTDSYEQDKFDKSETEIIDDLEELLSDAVELRMVSDVPVGVFLSGGYDSSLVTALLAKKHKIHTFTIGFNHKKYNEADHAREIAKHFKTEHTEHYVSNKAMSEKVESLPYFFDEPFGDSSAIPTIMVSELAKKDVKVALSADGGDETFCGYSKYFFLNKFANIFSSSFQKAILKSVLNAFDARQAELINSCLPKKIKQANIGDKFNKFKRAAITDSFEEMYCNASSYVDATDVKSFLNIEAENSIYTDFKMGKGLPLIDRMMLIDYKTFMVDDVLTKVDRATMSVSLEGREPLLDHRIIEFMARVPVDLKYKKNQGKYLTRQILYRHIPKAVIDKPKAGFQVPLEEWLLTDLKPLVEKYLVAGKLDQDIFDIEEIEKMKHGFFAGNATNVSAVWFILMYEMWREKWFSER